MTETKRSMPRPSEGLRLALLLASLLLAGSIFVVWRDLELLLPNDQFASSVRIADSLGLPLSLQLAHFAAALLLVHAALGLLVFGLARASEVIFPPRLQPRRGLITAWFVVIFLLVLVGNATLFPASNFAIEVSGLRHQFHGLYPVEIASLAFVLVALASTIVVLRNSKRKGRCVAITAVVIGCLAMLAGAWRPESARAAEPAAHSLPHVVIIGIDSMRADRSLPRLGQAAVPHVEEFITGSRRFTDATTPLARTFGSWVSILTGRHPVATNARVNLMPRKLVNEGLTLPDALRDAGYRATFATDEVRFANIDESYGFDQLITPPIGAADLLLGLVGDMPLVNLVASTPVGRVLFPTSHGNRGASVSYQPNDFVRRLDREIQMEPGQPSLIAVHLTLAHWPYSWAGRTAPSTPQAYRESYRDAIEEVDRQFGAVMRVLAGKGVLENALVVLLSDHGEALGAESDSMLRETGTHREIWHSLWGHGTSVLSPNQYRVVLAMRAYGHAKLPGAVQDYGWPVSLEDLRPTIEELVTAKVPADVDGVSLVPQMKAPARAAALAERIRFTETDFNTRNTLAGRYEPSGIIDEAADFYEFDPGTGWIQFRRDRLPDLLAQKQRAAFTSNMLLAAIPDPTRQGPRYLLTNRHAPLPVDLEGPPGAWPDADARRLWAALEARFPGELGTRKALP